jgi:7-carboxy-7-deazaguanine synthase
MKNQIILVEPLHLVLQGEGINIGKKMILMRLAGCNIQCPDCDTIYSWRFSSLEKKKLLFYYGEKIIEQIQHFKNSTNHLLITGGEPALWEENLVNLIHHLPNFYFDIETSGYSEWSLLKSHQLLEKIQFNISPKIGVLKPKKDLDIKDIKILQNPPIHYIIKIVTSKNNFKEDLIQIQKLIKEFHIPTEKIFLMPFGKRRQEIIEQSEYLIEQCFKYGFQFSPRLHILLFDDQRLK